jgi:ubiquinone/menaquinone biosynthesis C-methylase UbiE
VTTSPATHDPYSRWLFDRRVEGEDYLLYSRDRVVDGVRPGAGDTVLDVGSGDGFVAFEVARRVAPGGTVVFTDTSSRLLDYCAEVMRDRDDVTSQFVQTSAETLEGVRGASVDAVTCRSTLVYLRDKRAALASFARVLRPGGRLSLLEFVARFGWVERSDRYLTWDLGPLGELGDRFDEVFKRRDTLMDLRYELSERDLVLWAEELGLRDIHLDFDIDIETTPAMEWDVALGWAPNPCAPTLGEALDDEGFTDEERARLTAYLRVVVARGDAPMRSAHAHLTARK